MDAKIAELENKFEEEKLELDRKIDQEKLKEPIFEKDRQVMARIRHSNGDK